VAQPLRHVDVAHVRLAALVFAVEFSTADFTNANSSAMRVSQSLLEVLSVQNLPTATYLRKATFSNIQQYD
jgi:hypothetical protein